MEWLKWMKVEFSIQPTSVMIDNSRAEIAAINCAYNQDINSLEQTF